MVKIRPGVLQDAMCSDTKCYRTTFIVLFFINSIYTYKYRKGQRSDKGRRRLVFSVHILCHL